MRLALCTLRIASFDKYKCAVYRVTKNRRELFMANEKKVYEIIKDAGFKPIEDKGIVVKYAPENLSAKIANFFSMEFYVLQLCEDELVLVPFNTMTAGLKKEVTLQLPYSGIKSVTVNEDMLNYHRNRHYPIDRTAKGIKWFPFYRNVGVLQ